MKVQQAPFKVRATGTFTPPPAPCGHEGCGWVETTLVHVGDCPEKE
jgi:hypothetical protein